MRWALCTDDIYYAHPVLKNIFSAGRTMPIKRIRGMEQPLFKVNGALLLQISHMASSAVLARCWHPVKEVASVDSVVRYSVVAG